MALEASSCGRDSRRRSRQDCRQSVRQRPPRRYVAGSLSLSSCASQPPAATVTRGSTPSSARSSRASATSAIRRVAWRALPVTRRSSSAASAPARTRFDLLAHPVLAAGGARRAQALQARGREPLHEHAAQQLAGGRGAGLVVEDLDRHPERAEVRGEGLRPGAGGERRGAQPVARNHAHEGDVGELRAGRRDHLGHRALERGARRVEVGVDLACRAVRRRRRARQRARRRPP